MKPRMHDETAIALMTSFAERTGLTSDRADERYLWTDAFAVCNFLGLARSTGQKRYADLALRLVDHVHETLGRFRAGERHVGWLSGLGEREGAVHPTRGGLRIGKELPERRPEEPFDEELEWNRDGQYFHYLTQWMHALDRVARSTEKPVYNAWARELADTAFRAFTYSPSGGGRRMYWKMSVDLSRPLVPSMGQHDPLDGYVTYLELSATASELKEAAAAPDVSGQAAEFESMLEGQRLATADPLGIGGLLIDAFRLNELVRRTNPRSALVGRLLVAARAGLEDYGLGHELELPAARRLPFRELGLAIGLHAVERMKRRAECGPRQAFETFESGAPLDSLVGSLPLAEAIERFWLDPEHRKADTWGEHRNINEVMLATSLAPDGFLGPADE